LEEQRGEKRGGVSGLFLMLTRKSKNLLRDLSKLVEQLGQVRFNLKQKKGAKT